MQLHCLSDRPNKPCYVMRFKGVTLMLDCALDASTVLCFAPLPLVGSSRLVQTMSKYSSLQQDLGDGGPELSSLPLVEFGSSGGAGGYVYVDAVPEFAPPDVTGGGGGVMVDLAEVDAILISNYNSMLALPYVTENTGFRGSVFMTEPCLHFGRLFMEETIEFIERSSSCRRSGQGSQRWKELRSEHLPAPLGTALSGANPRGWKTMYSREQMESSLSKVTLVGFSERKDVFGLVTVSPASSGYCIGSSNWTIESGYEKIAYVSGSSTLTTHPRPMDQQPLRNADCLVLTALTQAPTMNPDPMIGEFCKSVIETTRNGGNVLVPCYPSGIAYDLLECLAGQMDLHGQSGVPMFFVSPVADSSLAYSNIMAEWLTSAKQNRVYMPEEPFPHGSLAKNGRLKSFRNLYDEEFNNEYRQPCVMFCGHPSLRFGDVIHFLELWGGNPNNTIVFTEPSFSHLEALAPFQPLQMKTVNCPIDTSLNFNQAKKLIRDLKPRMVAIPEVYASPPLSAPQRSELTIDVPDIPKYTFGSYQMVELPVKCTRDRIEIDPNLAAGLNPVQVKPGVAIATIVGKLNVLNNKYSLGELDNDEKGIGVQSDADNGQRRKKRKRNHPGALPSATHQTGSGDPPGKSAMLLPLRRRAPECHLLGSLDIREVVQKLINAGMLDAHVEEVSPLNYIIYLNKEETLIKLDQANRQTHVICNEGLQRNRELIRTGVRDVLLNCLEKY